MFLMEGDDGDEAFGSNVRQVDVTCGSTCPPGAPARARWGQLVPHSNGASMIGGAFKRKHLEAHCRFQVLSGKGRPVP